MEGCLTLPLRLTSDGQSSVTTGNGKQSLKISRVRLMITSVNPAEMPFRFECDMLNPLIACLPAVFRLNSGQRLGVLREPSIGSVIPDVLVGIWTGELP